VFFAGHLLSLLVAAGTLVWQLSSALHLKCFEESERVQLQCSALYKCVTWWLRSLMLLLCVTFAIGCQIQLRLLLHCQHAQYSALQHLVGE
jgi:hypothetical protein